jgi:hypothetical protein
MKLWLVLVLLGAVIIFVAGLWYIQNLTDLTPLLLSIIGVLFVVVGLLASKKFTKK